VRGGGRGRVCCGEVDSDEFWLWSNPELYVNPSMYLYLFISSFPSEK
jgi:hypothetical protein